MPNDRLRYRRAYWQMHFIIFLWGFTAVLGKLISLDALSLTWWRVGLSVFFLWLWRYGKKLAVSYTWKEQKRFVLLGLLLAVHWLSFFYSIKLQNVSVTLVTMSVSAFLTSVLEPVFYKRPFRLYEMLFGILIIFSLAYVFSVANVKFWAVFFALTASLAGVLFTLINGLSIRQIPAVELSFRQLLYAFVFLTLALVVSGKWQSLSLPGFSDGIWLLVLSLVCTAYAYTASLAVLKNINPYTLILSVNLEPVYGILLAIVFLHENREMGWHFYLGASMIILLVFIEGFIKIRSMRR